MDFLDAPSPENILSTCTFDECPHREALDAALKNERVLMTQQHRLYDANPIPASLWRTEPLEVIDCNDSVAKLVGAKDKEDYIDNIHNFLPEFQPCGTTSAEKLSHLLERVLKDGTAHEIWEHKHSSGEIIPGDVTLVRLDLHDTIMIAAYMQDLRPLHKADEKINAINRFNQMLLNTSPAGIDIWDSEDNFVDCNKRLLDAMGLKTKEEYAERYYELLPEYQPCGTLSSELEMRHTVAALSEGSVRYEWTCLTSDGELLPLEVNAFRVDLNDRKLIVCYSNDLRMLKAAMQLENEREISERMRMMFDATPLMIEYWNNHFEAIDCNQTTLDFYGFPDKETYRNNLFRNTPAFQPDGTPSRHLWNSHLDEIFATGEDRFSFVKMIAGETVFFEVQGVRMKYNDEIVVVTYKSDVTQKIKAEEERRRIEIAEEATLAKSRFLARMSHEIRTPITAVMGISEIQLQDPNLSPHTEDAFAKIFSAADMLRNLINDILDLSKIEAGKMSLRQTEYDVSSMISDVIHIAFSHAKNDKIKFQINIDEFLPSVLIGDFLRIRQILNNLLSNAFKYTDSGTVELSLRATPKNDGMVLLNISIRDTGLGMDEEQLKLIHKEYARFHENDRYFITGSGLGIPIVYSLLELMGGEIDIKSEPNKGTNVTVSIPQKVSGTKVLGKEAAHSLQQLESVTRKKQKLAPEPMPYGSVLVVDDVEANLFVAKGLLKFYDLRIETCSGGLDAIQKIRDGYVYDIIFMDHMMPGINGIEAMKIMRGIGYTRPIVALTANVMLGQEEELIETGFDGFISKPIQTNKLNTILTKLIRDKQPPEVLATVKAKKSRYIDDFMESDDIVKKLRSDFVHGQKDAIQNMRRAIKSGDFETARRLAHNLRGVSALINETTLSHAAAFIENILAGSKVPPQDGLRTLEDELNAVLAGIGNILPAPARADFDKEHATALFEKLSTLLSSRSADSLDMLDELRNIPETAVLIRLIEDFEFSAAAKALSALKGLIL